MGTAHTPGDWRVDGSFRVTVNAVQPDGSFWTIVACPGGSPNTPLHEAKANAALIAAAPDMLHALRRAAPWLARLIADGGHHGCAAPNDAVRTLQRVEAAIAKAEGRV